MAGQTEAPEGAGEDAAQAEPHAVRLVVSGRVQGVGFRWFVREKARRWGCDGWVRNQHDGSVHIAIRGVASQVRGLVADIQDGPKGAQVQGVDEQPGTGEDYPHPFEIRKDR